MTEQQLISKLQELKQIKPNANWVSLSKMNILESTIPVSKTVLQPARQWNFSNILGLIFQRKLAYAFAVLLFVFVGVAGILKYETPNVVNNTAKVVVKSEADVAAENTLKTQVADFKAKSQILSDVVKNTSQTPDLAIKEVKVAASKLTDELHKNPELAKVIALDVNNNKSLLDIPGGNNSDEVLDMYKTLVVQLMKDFDEVTLTPTQKDELVRIETSFSDGGDSATTLRDILLMNASIDSTK